MTIKEQIEMLLSRLSTQAQIDIIESLGKKYRRQNSMKMNAAQYGRKVDVRPDEINMKQWAKKKPYWKTSPQRKMK